MDRTFRMYRLSACRTTAFVMAAPLLLTAVAVSPAAAHGAPTDPVSRVSACSPEGDSQGSAACEAAIAANGAPFTAWDNMRIAGVNGRDREVVPDGQLCSGGLAPYKGLDLARADWPSARLSPGSTLNLTYRTTIPHTGTFKLFLTKPGYDPTEPLEWSDLPEEPFASITDPTLRDGSYRFSAKLPADRSGRHVLYTIWQNTSTVDTYYSCSDVVFPAAKKKGTSQTAPAKTEKPAPEASAESTPTEGSPSPLEPSETPGDVQAEVADSPVASASDSSDDSGALVPLVAGGATASVLAVVAVLLLRGRGRRSRIRD
ncbi:lytic polysaccharide monooxygenase auxiliary activity family 9 protein [Streptomyces capitiformicae]|nr:lytic polysaccharide monooxygenase [Streptomyces capitiformicae]